MLDCPGVVMSNDENSILYNIIRTEEIKEPVGKIFKKCHKIIYLRLLWLRNISFKRKWNNYRRNIVFNWRKIKKI